jgi:outer membrane receptor protein involved in Fe transport
MVSHRLLRLFLFLLICRVGAAYAQNGIIQGKVTGVDGDPIAGATISLEEIQFSSITNQNGEYKIDDIPEGTHILRITAHAYAPQMATILITAGQTVLQNFVLRIDLQALEEIVVTGSLTPEKKIESSTSISSLNANDIRDAAPRSTTEFLRRVPGFTRVESSGGEVNENIAVRGFLGVASVSIEEDGIPVYPSMDNFFMNADNLIRPDENLEKIEILMSGSSPIFGSSTAGAILNFLNKTGGSELHGTFMGTAGTSGLARFDFNVNGPISEDWRFSAGGFYRYDQGVRNPGYTASNGGQLKANATRLFSNGFFRVSVKYIDDKNLFILPLPFQNRNDPEYVPGFSDSGSFYTKEAVGTEIPLPEGSKNVQLPLDDGIKTKGTWVTGQLDFNFAGDWQFENIARVMSVDQNWNALVSSDLLSAADFAQIVLNNFINNGLVPPGTTYQLLLTNHVDASGNKLPFDSANGLVRPGGLWHIEKPVSDFSDILTLKKHLGSHNLSFGSYFAYYKQSNLWYLPDVLTDVRDNPRFLDLVLVQPNGTTLDVTKNGFLHFLGFYQNADGNSTVAAFFSSDEVKLTDRFRIDLGARYELEHYSQVTENLAPFDLDGDFRTQYDFEIWGSQTFGHFDSSIDDLAFSAGANYQISPKKLAVYGSFTRGFKLPSLDEFLFLPTPDSANQLKPFHTDMYESGLKYSGPHAGFTGAFFYGQLYDFIGHNVETDPVTGEQRFHSFAIPDSTVWGFEFEILTRPIQELEIHGSATLVNVELPDINQTGLFYDGLTPAALDFDATYLVFRNTRVMLDWHYVGERFTNSALTEGLSDYSYFNVGVSYRFPNAGFTIEGKILNLTQSKGLEEANPLFDSIRNVPRQLFLGRPLLPRRTTVQVKYDF